MSNPYMKEAEAIRASINGLAEGALGRKENTFNKTEDKEIKITLIRRGD